MKAFHEIVPDFEMLVALEAPDFAGGFSRARDDLAPWLLQTG